VEMMIHTSGDSRVSTILAVSVACRLSPVTCVVGGPGWSWVALDSWSAGSANRESDGVLYWPENQKYYSRPFGASKKIGRHVEVNRSFLSLTEFAA
jgi:hypothetical protein